MALTDDSSPPEVVSSSIPETEPKIESDGAANHNSNLNNPRNAAATSENPPVKSETEMDSSSNGIEMKADPVTSEPPSSEDHHQVRATSDESLIAKDETKEAENVPSSNETRTVAEVNDDNDAEMKEEEEEGEEEEVLDEDEWRDEMISVLDNTDFQGEFSFGEETELPYSHPRIMIEGMNERLAFPLPVFQAQQVIQQAEKAPFGKGLNTVLDESVRKAWQIDASRVRFDAPEDWNSVVASLARDCGANLGLTTQQRSNVAANLYKMLLYEPGGHFQKHRDTEKEPGMFGTMVLQLPSQHSGGGLVVYHGKEERRYDFSQDSANGCFLTAFYADCEHQFLPVTSGYRLCLVYNLVLQRKSQNSSELPTAESLTAQTRTLLRLERQWCDQTVGDRPMGYLLEHQYTETNLRFRNLKARDKQVAEMLQSVRDENGNPVFVVALLLLEKYEQGSCEASGGYYGRGSYSDDDDHVMDEIIDSRVNTTLWIGPNDEPLRNFKLRFTLENQLLSREDEDELFEGEEPDRQEYESYTGNAGPTLEYWYYKSAIVFWPRRLQMQIASEAGMDFLVANLMASTVDSDIRAYGTQILKLINGGKEPVTSEVLAALIKTRDLHIFLEVLRSSTTFIRKGTDMAIIKGIRTFGLSDATKDAICGLLERSIGYEDKSAHRFNGGLDNFKATVGFLDLLQKAGFQALVPAAREALLKGTCNDTVLRRLLKQASKMVLLAPLLVKDEVRLAKFITVLILNAPANVGPMLTRFVEAMPDSAKTNEHLIGLAKVRVSQLQVATRDGRPIFSWCQPKAEFPDSRRAYRVNEFLRGPMPTISLGGFHGIADARNWCSKYFGGAYSGNGYSANASAGGRGSESYVTITKTRYSYQTAVSQYKKDTTELAKIVSVFGPIFGNISLASKRLTESTNDSNKKSKVEAAKHEAGNRDDPIVL